jgi:hypothetical protein
MSNSATPKRYARVEWTADDLQTLREGWTAEQCEDWLAANERHIQDRLIELGWEVIECLLGEEGK